MSMSDLVNTGEDELGGVILSTFVLKDELSPARFLNINGDLPAKDPSKLDLSLTVLL